MPRGLFGVDRRCARAGLLGCPYLPRGLVDDEGSTVRPWRKALEDLETAILGNTSELRSSLEAFERAVEQNAEELNLLRSIDAELVRYAFDLDRVLVQIVNGVAKLTDATLSDLLLPNGKEELELAASSDASIVAKPIPINASITGRVFRTGESVRLDDARADADFVQLREELKSELAVPLKDQEGGVLGVINLESDQIGHFTPHHEALTVTVAGQAAIALQNARLYKQFLSLLDTFTVVQDTEKLQEILAHVGRRAMELADAEACQVLTQFGDELVIQFTTGNETPGATRVRINESITGLALMRGVPVRIGNLHESSEASAYYKDFLGEEFSGGMQSELVVPIAWKGTKLGVINLESPRRDAFTLHHERLVAFFGAQAAVAISAAHSFQEALWHRQVQSELWAMAQIGDAYGPMIHRLNSDAGAISAIVSEIRYRYRDLLAKESELAMRLTDIESKADRVLEVPSKLKRQLDRVVAFEELDVASMAGAVLSRFENTPGIIFKRHLDHVPNVLGSPQIEDVIENLLMNSVEALPGGRGTIVIGTRTWTSSDRAGNTTVSGVEIYVEDTCGGIPAARRRTLWEIDRAAKTEARFRHIGFGLWWIRAFVERVGGTVEVEPETIVEGVRGCRFTVRVPFKFRHGSGDRQLLPVEA